MITFTLVVLTLIPLVTLLYYSYYTHAPRVDLNEVYGKLLSFCKVNVSPKPDENFVFLVSVLCLPALVYASSKITLYITQFYGYNPVLQQSTKAMLVLISILMILFSYSSSYLANLVIPFKHEKMLVLILSALAIFMCHWYRSNYFKANEIGTTVLVLLVILSIILVSLSFRVSSVKLVSDSPSWVVNFGAAFYSVTQVFAGKTVLVNLPAQYGMYSEILKPLFKLIGFSVFKFTFVMEILQVVALLSIFRMLWRMMENKLLILICMLSFCFMTGFTWLFIQTGSPEPYYQYYPIRFFFPAISTLLFASLVNNQKLSIAIILSCLSTLAVIWNIESGIAVFGTFMTYLFSFILFPTDKLTRKNALKFILVTVTLFISGIFLFLLYLKWKSGHPLDLSLIFKYQHTFYLTGFCMLPIPRSPDVWHLMIATYLMGMCGAVLSWIKKTRSVKWDMIFCLSILGIALFVYYQGRAHPNVLVIATWPAIIILFMFCEMIFNLVRAQKLSKIYVIFCFPVLLFGLLLSTEFLYSTPFLFKSMLKRWQIILIGSEETPITRNIAYIKQNVGDKKEVIIVAPNQSVYYAETHLASPINGPGAIEIFLTADMDKLNQALELNTENIFFKRDTVGNSLDPYLENTIKNYRVISTSQDQMSLLGHDKQVILER